MSERRIVEYKMLRVSGNAMTTEAVNKEIADGFQPYGSKIHIETGSNFFHFYLPMVRYAEPEPTPDDEQDAEIERLRAENERLRAENERLSEENVDWHSCVSTDILMSGPVFTGGNRSALLRCFERYIRGAALADQTGGEG